MFYFYCRHMWCLNTPLILNLTYLMAMLCIPQVKARLSLQYCLTRSMWRKLHFNPVLLNLNIFTQELNRKWNHDITHQFLGVFKTQAANMNNHLIHPVERRTFPQYLFFNCILITLKPMVTLGNSYNVHVLVRLFICVILGGFWVKIQLPAMTHLPFAFRHHSSARSFLSSTLRDMLSPVVPFTASKETSVQDPHHWNLNLKILSLKNQTRSKSMSINRHKRMA